MVVCVADSWVARDTEHQLQDELDNQVITRAQLPDTAAAAAEPAGHAADQAQATVMSCYTNQLPNKIGSFLEGCCYYICTFRPFFVQMPFTLYAC